MTAPCRNTSNIRCDKCSICGSMEYESIQCATGHNRLCNSCKVCSFLDDNDIGKTICPKDPHYYSWYQNNCCLNELGKVVSDELLLYYYY